MKLNDYVYSILNKMKSYEVTVFLTNVFTNHFCIDQQIRPIFL